jgi:hypothetical protein
MQQESAKLPPQSKGATGLVVLQCLGWYDAEYFSVLVSLSATLSKAAAKLEHFLRLLWYGCLEMVGHRK